MAVADTRGVPSRAAVRGHPLHPLLIPLPITLLSLVTLTDVLHVVTHRPFWAEMSWWMLAGGLFTGVIAAVAGLVDFVGLRRPRTLGVGWLHAVGNVLALLAAAADLAIRPPDRQVLPQAAFGLSIVLTLLLLITGWAGGELSYRHGVGVVGEGPEPV